MRNQMKEIIAEEFIALIRKKNIDKITVTDLVNACGIARQTFYYHFQDILEVMEWAAQQQMQQALTKSLQAGTPKDAVRELVVVIVQEYALIEKLLSSQKREFVEVELTRTIQSYLRELTLRRAPGAASNFADPDMALCFYAGGIVSVLMQYAGRKDVDIEELTGQLTFLLLGKYFDS